MRLLVDTHCWLWMQAAPERFRKSTRKLLEDPSTQVLLSAASSWEIVIKHALGKLVLPEPPERYVPARMARSATLGLPVEHAHALRIAALPLHHRDPFDRILVAQCQVEGLPLLTADGLLAAYDIEVLRP
jgi:PIN domain nuclease of toxin-antitoxin system